MKKQPVPKTDAEAVHLMIVHLAKMFPGLPPLAMDDYDDCRQVFLELFRKIGWERACSYAEHRGALWALRHSQDIAEEGIDRALDVWKREQNQKLIDGESAKAA